MTRIELIAVPMGTQTATPVQDLPPDDGFSQVLDAADGLAAPPGKAAPPGETTRPLAAPTLVLPQVVLPPAEVSADPAEIAVETPLAPVEKRLEDPEAEVLPDGAAFLPAPMPLPVVPPLPSAGAQATEDVIRPDLAPEAVDLTAPVPGRAATAASAEALVAQAPAGDAAAKITTSKLTLPEIATPEIASPGTVQGLVPPNAAAVGEGAARPLAAPVDPAVLRPLPQARPSAELPAADLPAADLPGAEAARLVAAPVPEQRRSPAESVPAAPSLPLAGGGYQAARQIVGPKEPAPLPQPPAPSELLDSADPVAPPVLAPAGAGPQPQVPPPAKASLALPASLGESVVLLRSQPVSPEGLSQAPAAVPPSTLPVVQPLAADLPEAPATPPPPAEGPRALASAAVLTSTEDVAEAPSTRADVPQTPPQNTEPGLPALASPPRTSSEAMKGVAPPAVEAPDDLVKAAAPIVAASPAPETPAPLRPEPAQAQPALAEVETADPAKPMPPVMIQDDRAAVAASITAAKPLAQDLETQVLPERVVTQVSAGLEAKPPRQPVVTASPVPPGLPLTVMPDQTLARPPVAPPPVLTQSPILPPVAADAPPPEAPSQTVETPVPPATLAEPAQPSRRAETLRLLQALRFDAPPDEATATVAQPTQNATLATETVAASPANLRPSPPEALPLMARPLAPAYGGDRSDSIVGAPIAGASVQVEQPPGAEAATPKPELFARPQAQPVTGRSERAQVTAQQGAVTPATAPLVAPAPAATAATGSAAPNRAPSPEPPSRVSRVPARPELRLAEEGEAPVEASLDSVIPPVAEQPQAQKTASPPAAERTVPAEPAPVATAPPSRDQALPPDPSQAPPAIAETAGPVPPAAPVTVPAPQVSTSQASALQAAALQASATAGTQRAAETARDFAPRMVRRIAETGQRRSEIVLEPAELGKLRFELVTRGDKVEVNLAAERPATLDLMRQHVAELRQEFRAAGLDAGTMNFSHWGQGSREERAFAPLPDFGGEPGLEPEMPFLAPIPSERRVVSTGLDLRL